MATSAERSQFMADAIEDRRRELELSPGELVERVGRSAQGVLNMRKGLLRKYSDMLKREMCHALRWTPDSIDRLLRGEPPTPLRMSGRGRNAVDVVSLAKSHAELSEQVADLAGQMAALARRFGLGGNGQSPSPS